MLIKVYASDGKEFKGEDYNTLVKQVEDYEAEQKAKREKEEADRKAREEKQKRLIQFRTERLKDINAKAKELNDMVNDFEKATGRKLYYTLNDEGLVVKERTTSTTDLFDDWFSFWI